LIFLIYDLDRGLYIGKYPPLWGRGKYQPMSFGGKNMKRRREKGENVKEKGRKGKKERKGKETERKGKETERKGKENEKRGSKRVK
jgi:hypothetical protein